MDLGSIAEAFEAIGHAIDGKRILAIRKERVESIVRRGMRDGLSAEKIANKIDRASYQDTHWNTDKRTFTVKL